MARESELLRVNQRIELRRENDDEVYFSLVQEVGEEHFAVQLPMRGGTEVPLHPGEQVEVRIPTERGRYVFNTSVLERYYDRVPLCRLAKPREIFRIQKREYVRWRVSLEVRYEVAEGPPGDSAPVPALRRRAVSVDLSGGGIQLLVREALPVGTWLWLEFELPYRGATRRIQALGRVRRLASLEDEGPRRFAVGISFEKIGEREREAIIAFIFQRMVSERTYVLPEG
ncbi:MAG: flagellar brake protein [Moorellales bacterium]